MLAELMEHMDLDVKMDIFIMDLTVVKSQVNVNKEIHYKWHMIWDYHNKQNQQNQQIRYHIKEMVNKLENYFNLWL